MIRVENWCGYEIRFIEKDGEWWAVLKDICDALRLRTDKVASRLNPVMMGRVLIEFDTSDHPSRVIRSRGENKTRWMLVINEFGIYEALFANRKLEARKFRFWAGTVMQKLRKSVGLEGYEVMRMTEKEIRYDIDHILDTLYYDEETGKLIDVDQIEFEP